MFCPKCAAEITSDETTFCSKCGLALKSVRKIIESGDDANEISEFQKGIRFGVKLLLLSLILLPAFQILGAFFVPDDKLVESSPSSSWFDLAGNAILFTLALAGIARIFYAFVFERPTKSKNANETIAETIKEVSSREKNALPSSNAMPISDFGKWKTTGELFEPIFVKPKTSGELK